MVAAFYGSTECVRILAEKEAKMQDGGKMTALMYAAGQGHLDCVKILAPLEEGMCDKWNDSALTYASARECAQFLW